MAAAQAPAIFQIDPEPGAVLDEAAVLATLAPALAEFKRPRRVQILAALPRLGSGKIDKRRLANDRVKTAPAVTWTGEAGRVGRCCAWPTRAIGQITTPFAHKVVAAACDRVDAKALLSPPALRTRDALSGPDRTNPRGTD